MHGPEADLVTSSTSKATKILNILTEICMGAAEMLRRELTKH